MRETVYWSIRIAGYAVGAAIAGLFLALALPDMLRADWHSTKYLTHILFTLFAGLALWRSCHGHSNGWRTEYRPSRSALFGKSEPQGWLRHCVSGTGQAISGVLPSRTHHKTGSILIESCITAHGKSKSDIQTGPKR
jgi:hypothetical protein